MNSADDTATAGLPGNDSIGSVLRRIMASRLYRGATVAMFLSGVGTSAAAPQIALFLVHDLGASLSTAGLFYLTNLTAPIAGYLVGSRSDRTGRRMGLFRACAISGGLAWIGIALSGRVWMPFVISAVVLGFAGAAASQLFAVLRDDLNHNAGPGNDAVFAAIRMALTAGWVVGPVLGSWAAARFGLRALLFGTGLLVLAQLIPLGRLRTPAARPHVTLTPGDIGSTFAHRFRTTLPLLIFVGLYVLVYAGESVKYAFLPIYMNQDLHLRPAISGAVIGIQPLIELMIMPFSVLLARRIGPIRLMSIGATCGVGANLCFALSGTTTGMFTGQILMGGVWGIFAAIGIIVA